MEDNVKYVNVQKDSQFFTSLEMIHDCLLSDESKEYVRIGIKNTINGGGKLINSNFEWEGASFKKPNIVPYQLCPKCFGTGKVMNNENWGNYGTISSAPVICDVCNGAKIIPQSII